jgi:type IV pilus biogenesis protein PilP
MKINGMKNMGALSQLTNRQKITGIVFIIGMLILLWQVADILGIGSATQKVEAKPSSTKHQQLRSVKPVQKKAIALSPALLKLQKKSAERAGQYTDAVNALELLKLKAQESALNQEIFEAKLKEVEAQKAIKDLTTVKAKPAISVSQYAETLANKRVDLPATKAAKATKADATTQTSPVAQNWAVNLKLLFISNQAGKMTAIIGISGVLYEVQEGSSLPGGLKVQGINPKKVYVVNLQGKTHTLTLTPVI